MNYIAEVISNILLRMSFDPAYLGYRADDLQRDSMSLTKTRAASSALRRSPESRLSRTAVAAIDVSGSFSVILYI